MSRIPRQAKRDAAEKAIIAALETAGCSVMRHSGKDEPDLVIGFRGQTWVAEVKSGEKELDFLQRIWWLNWQGNDLVLLRSVADAEAFLRSL